MREHCYWVYILGSGPCGYLYVGVTNDLVRRIEQHRAGTFEGHPWRRRAGTSAPLAALSQQGRLAEPLSRLSASLWPG